MLEISYDKRLKDIAKTNAKKCQFKHSLPENNYHPEFHSPKKNDIGENIYYVRTSQKMNFKEIMQRAIKKWGDEKEEYYYWKDTCIHEDKDCGHYRQIVKANMYAVGCAGEIEIPKIYEY